MGVTQEDPWQGRIVRGERYLPYPLLALSLALAAGSVASGWSSWEVYRWTVVLAVVTAVWTYLLDTRYPNTPKDSGRGTVFFVGRWFLALALVVANPWFGFYTFVGYIDALRLFSFRRAVVGILATAPLSAIAQMAGPPDATVGSLVAFGVLCLVNGGLAGAFSYYGMVVERQNEERRRAIDELEVANAKLQQALTENAGLHAQLVAQAREAGALDERARLAREIHDTLAQGLTGIVAQLQAAERRVGDDSELRMRFEKTMQLARHSLAEARRSVEALSPAALEHADLPIALKAEAERWTHDTGVRTELVTTGEAIPLHPEAEAALLRTAQEALTNVAKHASASRVAITLSYMGDVVSLDVRDDGQGFTTASPSARTTDGTGFGLVGMRQRLATVAGTLEIESEPGGGTALSATVPTLT